MQAEPQPRERSMLVLQIWMGESLPSGLQAQEVPRPLGRPGGRIRLCKDEPGAITSKTVAPERDRLLQLQCAVFGRKNRNAQPRPKPGRTFPLWPATK